MDLINGAWPWYIGGPLIALTMALLLLLGKRFGVSSNFDTLCSIGGAGRISEYFNFDWKKKIWGLVFLVGSVIGGWIAVTYMNSNDAVAISTATAEHLGQWIDNPGSSLIPESLFNWDNLFTPKVLIMLLGGGFLVGFGTRYAGGCTSGHAISGLSNLQLPSLIAVIGFFIGGLAMTWFILPLILAL
jgi:uncharacterized membrane protein YedE/YeeE